MIKFVHWYNHTHQHSAINFVTPHARHEGFDRRILENRTEVYENAKRGIPNRWSKTVRNWDRVETVYLNTKHAAKQAA